MAVSLSLLAGAGWQLFDNSGDVLTGGKLYTYAAGTTTPLASYTSSTGLTANANPIILDAAGRVPNQVWLTDAVLYKFVLETSAGVQLGAWDNVFSQLNSISFGTTGLTPATATSGAVTVGGILNVANGGTGLTSLTTGRIPFGNGTAAFSDAVGLTYTPATNTLAAPIISATTSITNAGNTLLSGTAARIQGDFSNATLANRTAFQDKTTNAVTGVIVLPNGTATQAVHTVFNNSNPASAGYFGIGISSTLATLTSANTGAGTALPMVFAVGAGAPEVARFDTSGNFYVGMTTYLGSGCAFEKLANGGRLFVGRTNNDTVAEWNHSGIRVGSVSITGSSTTYNTSSDYRLKENVQSMTGALAKVQALNPVTFTWKRTGEQGQGFIAHELQAVIPTAVTGDKDSVYEDGTPRYQGVDASYVVATLVAAVKELSARVAALEAK